MLEQLKQQQTNLILQRSQAKDIVDQSERALAAIGHTIQILEAQAKAEAEASEDAE